jgi:Zn-finger nucleic acid-binding protein
MYRDRPYQCPQCGIELGRDDARDSWTCGRCGGVLLGAQELDDVLGPFGETLMANAGAGQPATRPCPACAEAMRSFELPPLVLERCEADALLWFDHGELRRLKGNLNNAAWVERFLGIVLA